jgi:hypothetical protein
MGMFEMERIPLIASKIILIEVEWVSGIRKTIDECNSNHLFMKNYVDPMDTESSHFIKTTGYFLSTIHNTFGTRSIDIFFDYRYILLTISDNTYPFLDTPQSSISLLARMI